jgi:hypothetical protein
MSQGFTSQLPVPLPTAQGGTGLTSTTAYAVLCGGTTSTGNLQSIAGVGTSGQVLTSNGAGALPTFQTLQSGNVGAWVNFNGTGTVAIRGSGNVTSITDNGTGDYTVNYTNSFANTNYAIVGMVRFTSNGSAIIGGETNSTTWQATGSARINVITTAGGLADSAYTNVVCIS